MIVFFRSVLEGLCASSYTYTHSAAVQALSGNVKRRHIEIEQSKRRTYRWCLQVHILKGEIISLLSSLELLKLTFWFVLIVQISTITLNYSTCKIWTHSSQWSLLFFSWEHLLLYSHPIRKYMSTQTLDTVTTADIWSVLSIVCVRIKWSFSVHSAVVFV